MGKNIEIEVKILEVNFQNTSQKIENLGGVLDFYKKKFTAVWMQNAYGQKYRIRQEGDKIIEEVKISLPSEGNMKKCLEIGKEVDDFGSAIHFGQALGFEQISHSVKERTQYILDLRNKNMGIVSFVLDTYTDLDGKSLPTLLEIEGEDERIILYIAEQLGYKKNELKNRGVSELIDFYREFNKH